MDERTIQSMERPLQGAEPGRAEAGVVESAQAGPGVVEPVAGLADPRALTILTTEHWSLLSARALVYNEAFARAGMFLTFLSATLVALGLASTATGFSREFLAIAAVVLALDLFIGAATMGRMRSASSEDLRCLQGMNRLRHAYHEMVPGLERYFVFGKHDDVAGVFGVYGPRPQLRSVRSVVHGLTTSVGMVGVICCALAAVLAAVVVLLTTGSALATAVAALAVFVVANVIELRIMLRSVAALGTSMTPLFPSPPSDARPSEAGAVRARGA